MQFNDSENCQWKTEDVNRTLQAAGDYTITVRVTSFRKRKSNKSDSNSTGIIVQGSFERPTHCSQSFRKLSAFLCVNLL